MFKVRWISEKKKMLLIDGSREKILVMPSRLEGRDVQGQRDWKERPPGSGRLR